MKNTKTSETLLYLPREIFNTLVSALTYFIASESQVGETFFSKHSAKLKTKIYRYGRIIDNRDNKNSDSVLIKFFGIEAAVTVKLLAYYISLGENPTADYFTELKNIKAERAKNGGYEKLKT